MFWLFSASALFAQASLASSNAVSLYELSHKTLKQARRLVDKGTLQLNKQQYSSSLELFRRALQLDPQYWRAQNNIGFVYLKLHQQKEAEDAFQRAVEIDPDNAIGHTNVGICALSGNNYSLAEQAAQRALRLRPLLIEAKALLGLAQAGQGHWTPQVRQLLEDSRSASQAAETLLRRWPANVANPPRLVVLTSDR